MSMYAFSPSRIGFYDYSYEDEYRISGSWPSDLIEVSEIELKSFAGASPDGMVLGSDDEGKPAWVPAPEKTKEERLSEADALKLNYRVKADSEIAWRQDAVDAETATDDEISDLAAWKKYRVLLMRVDVSNPEWPSVPE